MKNFRFGIRLTGVLVCFLITGLSTGPGNTWGSPEDAQTIERKIDVLIHLHAEMAACINTARSIRAELMVKDRTFIAEIQTARKHLKDTTYRVAIADHRIRSNLKLIQMVAGYCNALDEKIDSYQRGLSRLKYIINRSEDELKMYKALGRLELGDLLTEIDQVIAEYQAEIKSDVIQLDKVSVPSCESIWQDVMAGSIM